MSFNPREALNKIRSHKIPSKNSYIQESKQYPQLFDEESHMKKSFYEKKQIKEKDHVIQDESKNKDMIQMTKRIENLEKNEKKLSDQLSKATQQIIKLRRQKSLLQTQIINLRFDKAQLKNQPKIFKQKQVKTQNLIKKKQINNQKEEQSMDSIFKEITEIKQQNSILKHSQNKNELIKIGDQILSKLINNSNEKISNGVTNIVINIASQDFQ